MPRDHYDAEDEDDYDRPRRQRSEDSDGDDRRRRDDDYDRPRRSRHREEDDFDRPPATSGNGMAAAALVLGVLSICFGPLTGIIGGILGTLGLRKSAGKGMAATGLILSGFFSLVWVGLGVWGMTTLPTAAVKQRMNNNGVQLGIATHGYHDANASIPVYVRRAGDVQGQAPSDLDDRLGWRVNLLPYMEQDYLYRRFNLNEPWNSGTNMPLSSTVVGQYADTDTPTDPDTRFRCFYDNGAAFDTGRPARIPATFADGTSNTILYVEGGEKVTWSRFKEYKFDPNGPLPALGHPKRDVFLVVLADGSTRWLKKSINPNTLKLAITSADGQIMPNDW